MGKTIQNVLASNSDGTIAYICGKCHSEVAKEAKVCQSCGAKLGNIRCPFCNFKGDLDDFKNDTCPKCGRKKTLDIKNNTVNKDNRKQKVGGYTSTNIKSNFLKKYFSLLLILLLSVLILLSAIFLFYFDLI